ncbi:MAG: hypothetical protein WA581_18690 [Candidatus Acidiferrales bacterium]
MTGHKGRQLRELLFEKRAEGLKLLGPRTVSKSLLFRIEGFEMRATAILRPPNVKTGD